MVEDTFDWYAQDASGNVFDDVVRTRDRTPLEADVVEEKSDAPDVGVVHELTTSGGGTGEEVVLVEFTPGG